MISYALLVCCGAVTLTKRVGRRKLMQPHERGEQNRSRFGEVR